MLSSSGRELATGEATMGRDPKTRRRRKGRILSLTVLCWAWWGWSAPAEAACEPSRMVRIVTRVVGPSVPAGSFAAKPKTLYRLGARYGRVEELPNPASGLHLLVVVNEPDVWMVNRVDRTGQHMVDKGPTYNFRAVIFDEEGMPLLLQTLELGCEGKFLKENGAKPTGGASVRGRACASWVVNAGALRVEVCLDTITQKPLRVVVSRSGAVLMNMEYDSYEDDLAPDLTLFERPTGVRFVEAGG